MVTIRMDDGGQKEQNRARILVVGAGGGGGNAVNNMVAAGLNGTMFVAANTDRQALEDSRADVTIQLGKQATRGLGAGADPTKGREAALEDKTQISELVKGCDMVFVTAGMGGGTGTGSAPVIAQVAREAGALTVGVVTRPFTFEGVPRQRNAEMGIRELAKSVDSLIVIPNDRLLDVSNEPLGVLDAFKMADSVLRDAVRSISDLIVVPGLINVDFADAKRIMKGKGKAIMGMGEASGEGRAAEAAQRAMTSSLLEETNINGATGVLVNISGGQDLKIQEINQAMQLIQKAADSNAEIIMGCVVDQTLTDRVKVTIIATGFDLEREAGRRMESEGTSEMPRDTAMPGDHWAQKQQRNTGMLNSQRMTQEPPQPAVNRNMLAKDRVPVRTYDMATPPPVPKHEMMPAGQPAMVREDRPAVERDFDPTNTKNWF
jgi:cell division protein FtsZ